LPILVDLRLQSGEGDLGGLVGRRRLALVPLLAGQRVFSGVHDRLEAPGRELADVTAPAATTL
jgi:hypothetical protein